MMPYLRSLALRAWRGDGLARDLVFAVTALVSETALAAALWFEPNPGAGLMVAALAIGAFVLRFGPPAMRRSYRRLLHSPPGGALLVVARILGSRRRRVLEQNIRDMRDEVFEALSAGRLGEARLIHLKWLAVCWLDVLRTPWLLLAGFAELARKLAGGGS